MADEDWIEIGLVRVEVFGGPDECPKCDARVPWGYGLCDVETFGMSDCNRASGHIFRVDDLGRDPYNGEDPAIIWVKVRTSDLPKLIRDASDATIRTPADPGVSR